MKYTISLLIIVVNIFAAYPEISGEFITHSVGQGNCQTCVYNVKPNANEETKRIAFLIDAGSASTTCDSKLKLRENISFPIIFGKETKEPNNFFESSSNNSDYINDLKTFDELVEDETNNHNPVRPRSFSHVVNDDKIDTDKIYNIIPSNVDILFIFLSHTDKDHINYVEDIVKNYLKTKLKTQHTNAIRNTFSLRESLPNNYGKDFIISFLCGNWDADHGKDSEISKKVSKFLKEHTTCFFPYAWNSINPKFFSGDLENLLNKTNKTISKKDILKKLQKYKKEINDSEEFKTLCTDIKKTSLLEVENIFNETINYININNKNINVLGQIKKYEKYMIKYKNILSNTTYTNYVPHLYKYIHIWSMNTKANYESSGKFIDDNQSSTIMSFTIPHYNQYTSFICTGDAEEKTFLEIINNKSKLLQIKESDLYGLYTLKKEILEVEIQDDKKKELEETIKKVTQHINIEKLKDLQKRTNKVTNNTTKIKNINISRQGKKELIININKIIKEKSENILFVINQQIYNEKLTNISNEEKEVFDQIIQQNENSILSKGEFKTVVLDKIVEKCELNDCLRKLYKDVRSHKPHHVVLTYPHHGSGTEEQINGFKIAAKLFKPNAMIISAGSGQHHHPDKNLIDFLQSNPNIHDQLKASYIEFLNTHDQIFPMPLVFYKNHSSYVTQRFPYIWSTYYNGSIRFNSNDNKFYTNGASVKKLEEVKYIECEEYMECEELGKIYHIHTYRCIDLRNRVNDIPKDLSNKNIIQHINGNYYKFTDQEIKTFSFYEKPQFIHENSSCASRSYDSENPNPDTFLDEDEFEEQEEIEEEIEYIYSS